MKGIILIDGGYFDSVNFFLGDTRNQDIDIEKFSTKVCNHFDVDHVRTNFYHSYPYQSENPSKEEKEEYRKAQRFFKSINQKKNHQFKKNRSCT